MPEREGFLQWVADTYGEQALQDWIQRGWLNPQYPDMWMRSDLYSEWQTAGSPSRDVVVPAPAPSFVPPAYPYAGIESLSGAQTSGARIEDALSGLQSLEELWITIQSWLDGGYISKADAADLFDSQSLRIAYLSVPEEVQKELQQFTSEVDLAGRINRLGLDKDTSDALYEGILRETSDLGIQEMKNRGAISKALEGAREQVSSQTLKGLTKKYTEPNAMYLADEVENVIAQEKQKFQGELTKMQEKNQIDQLYFKFQNDPNINPMELSKLKTMVDSFSKGDYQPGLGQAIYDNLQIAGNQLQQQSKIDYLKGASGTGLLPGEIDMRAVANARQQALRNYVPQMQSPQPVIENVLAGANYAPGSRLSGFITGELQKSLQDPAMQKARETWWREVSRSSRDPIVTQLNWGSSLASRNLARDPSLSPDELGKLLSGVYSGIGADPLYGGGRYKPEEVKKRYYRQPGTGLVNRLSPSVRYR